MLTEDRVKLSKQLSEGSKRSVYWNKYKTFPNKNEVGTNDNPKHIRELIDPSYQGVKRQFVLPYSNAGGDNRVSADFHQKYFLPRVNSELFLLAL